MAVYYYNTKEALERHINPTQHVYLLFTDTVDCTQLRAVLPPLQYLVKLYPLLCRVSVTLLADVLPIVALLRKVNTSFCFTFSVIGYVSFV